LEQYSSLNYLIVTHFLKLKPPYLERTGATSDEISTLLEGNIEVNFPE